MESALEWSKDLEAIVTVGLHLAETYNTSAMDSFHLAAALLLRADEFVTAERPGRPMYLVRDLNVRFMDDLDDL